MGRKGKPDVYPESGWGGLANAIIKQAAEDYVSALNDCGPRYAPDHRIAEIRNFIRSDWFGQLCNLDPDYLLERLNRIARENRRKEKANDRN